MPATLAHVRKVYGERAEAMGEALTRELGDAITFRPPLGGLFFWAKLTGARGQPTDATDFAQRAIKRLVAFVPGAPFFADRPDHATLRLSFATANLEQIGEGVARLASAL